MDRRYFSSAALLALTGAPLFTHAHAGNALAEQLARIEKASGGRLGVSVLDTGTGARAGHRIDERFAMCSTFKFLVAAAVLARVDQKRENLERRIVVQPGDLLAYAPVTEKRVGGDGMTVAELCDAAVTLSDNPAANLLLASLGGPKAFTAYVRTLGDQRTRLDRTEPTMNDVRRGDPRDTTTPDAMLGCMQKLLLGDALSAASREQLLQWLYASKTGDKRLRAGLPRDWKSGDKTGSGKNKETNDIAILFPPGRAPILVTAYLADTQAAPEARDATLASVGAAVAAAL